MKPIEDMTREELYALKKERYEEARKDGTLQKIRLVGVELGRDINARYGPKYVLQVEDIHLYVDTYGGYMTVHLGAEDTWSGGKEVLSTHQTSEFIIRGEWTEKLLELYPEAEAKKMGREYRIEDERRRDLLDKLV